MLESIDFSRPHLSKEEYKPRRDALMEELVVLQQEAVKKGVGLVVLFEGWNGAGKGSRISDLMYNLTPAPRASTSPRTWTSRRPAPFRAHGRA